MHNCCRMTDSGHLEVGIPLLGERENPCVRIAAGDQSDAVFVRRWDEPVIDGSLLLEARPGKDGLIGRGNWRGVLLWVSTLGLEFPTESSSWMGDIRNAWSGIETIGDQIFALGNRQERDQDQLVVIENEEIVFAADQGKRYMRIQCNNCVLTARPAQKLEFAQMLVTRAEERVHSHAGLLWTKKTLQTIGATRLWSRTLDHRMHELERK